MRKSIFFKIFSGYLVSAILLTGLILIFSFTTLKSHYINTLISNLKNLGTTLLLRAQPLLEKGQYDKLDSLAKDLGSNIGTRITIIDLEGVVLADSEKDPKLMENHKDRPEIRRALENTFGKSLRYSTTVKEEMLYVALPIKKDGRNIGVLRVSLFLKDINSLLSDLRVKIIQIALIIVVISLIGAAIFARSLTRPIRNLAEASHKVASGDFDTRIISKSRDELGEFVDSFNYMVSQTKKLFTELSQQREKLNTIISSIQAGLLVLDKDGKIILCNDSFKKLVKTTNVEGKLYWELLRNSQLIELIKKTGAGKITATKEIEFEGMTYICSATFLSSTEEILLTLQDTTEISRLAKVKKDFVVNVSHELRTPLTAIKGFIETLELEGGKGKRYIERLKTYTDRLINIVKDLLTLSELESIYKLELEDVNLKNTIAKVLKIFEARIKEKNLKTKFDATDAVIKADSFKLEQVFINLIDNAIKYTEKGEIRISINQENKRVKIEISDTGIGIPKEHLSRIFERFYVVDKSRSRRLGGTGLGLSIVKHIILLHNGKIDINSEPGKGTTVIILLPTNIS